MYMQLVQKLILTGMVTAIFHCTVTGILFRKISLKFLVPGITFFENFVPLLGA